MMQIRKTMIFSTRVKVMVLALAILVQTSRGGTALEEELNQLMRKKRAEIKQEKRILYKTECDFATKSEWDEAEKQIKEKINAKYLKKENEIRARVQKEAKKRKIDKAAELQRQADEAEAQKAAEDHTNIQTELSDLIAQNEALRQKIAKQTRREELNHLTVDELVRTFEAEGCGRRDALKRAKEFLSRKRRRLLRRSPNEHPMDRLKRRLLQQNRYSRANEHPMDRVKRRLLQQNRY